MNVSRTHIRHQLPVIATLAKTVISSIRPTPENASGGAGTVFEQTVAPRSRKLVDDFIEHIGGDPTAYAGVLPPSLFPQWGFPVIGKTLDGLPYNMRRVLNGGCRIEINSPLPSDQPLLLRATLEDIDDNGYRAIFKQKLTCGTADISEAWVCYVTAVLPLKKAPGEKKEKPAPPKKAKEIDRWDVAGDAGLEFAFLTGDFNPVHWIRPYAKLSGFKSTILHGFSTIARAIESLNAEALEGRPENLKTIDARFVSPFLIPGSAGVYLDKNNIYVAPAAGETAFLAGTFTSTKGEK